MENDRIERKTLRLWPEAGKMLGFGKAKVYGMAQRGELPGCVRIGNRYLVLKAPFERYLSGETGKA